MSALPPMVIVVHWVADDSVSQVPKMQPTSPAAQLSKTVWDSSAPVRQQAAPGRQSWELAVLR